MAPGKTRSSIGRARPTGKNAWLIAQGLFLAFYLAAMMMAFSAVRQALGAIPAAA